MTTPQQRWRAKNPDKVRSAGARQRARLAAAQKRYHMTHRGRAKMMWHAAKRRAEEKGVAFSLPFEWVLSRVQAGHCEVTGLPFSLERRIPGRMNAPYAPSIDRRDSSKGYTLENCRVVVWALNTALGQWGEEVFAVVAKAFAESEWLR